MIRVAKSSLVISDWKVALPPVEDGERHRAKAATSVMSLSGDLETLSEARDSMCHWSWIYLPDGTPGSFLGIFWFAGHLFGEVSDIGFTLTGSFGGQSVESPPEDAHWSADILYFGGLRNLSGTGGYRTRSHALEATLSF